MNTQDDLFQFEENATAERIPGLTYALDVLSESEELDLISKIDDSGKWSSAMRRRVQHYGFRYDYRSRRIDSSMVASSFPEWLEDLARRLTKSSLMAAMPDQAIVNEYLPGQGIYKHVDCEPCFGPEITSLSLGSSCVMLFTHIATGEVLSLFLRRRGFLRLTGSARYEWMHGIPPRRVDHVGASRVVRERRLSITFRNVIIS